MVDIFQKCPETEAKMGNENLKKSYEAHKIYKLFTNSEYREKAIILLTFKIKNKYMKERIIEYVNKNNHLEDKKIYDAILSIIKGYNIFNYKRGINVHAMQKSVANWRSLNPQRYLDVGCFQGDITISVGEHFNLDKTQIYGIDIKKYIETNNFTYTVYNGLCIPYADESFDLITCFMVLHHVPAENLKTLLGEIYRVLKPEGTFIIKEHDATGNDYLLLDVLHEYYDYVLNPTRTWEESAANYQTHKYWTQKIIGAGFKQNKIPREFGKYGPLDIYKSYILSYKK